MKKIPSPSKKRLVLLSRFLEQVESKKITSVQISEKMLWSEATIRRDISLLEIHNGVSNGYDVKILKKAIDETFGLCANGANSKKHNCAIVGLGNLGQAFLENSVFESGIFSLVAAFDSNQNRVEILKSRIPLYQTLDLEKIIRQEKIEFVILTVEDEKAQKMTDRLVKYGIKGLVNYTNVILTVPEGFRLKNASPEKSLAGLV